MGQMKEESRCVAMVAWCSPARKTADDWISGFKGEHMEILVFRGGAGGGGNLRKGSETLRGSCLSLHLSFPIYDIGSFDL